MTIAEHEISIGQRELIEEVAKLLSYGLNPMKLRGQGRVQDAVNLSNNIGYLEGLGLMGEVDKRKAELQEKTKKKANKKPPPKRGGRKPRQYALEDMHQESRYAVTPRDRVLAADVAASRRQQLKEAGYNEAERVAEIRKRAKENIERRLQPSGVWKMMLDGPMTYEKAEKIVQILREFDKDEKEEERYNTSKVPKPDLDSSDGFTIYPSVKAWNKDHDIEE